MKTILFINGPNLNMLGVREPEIYGTTTLPEIERIVAEEAQVYKMKIVAFQSNHEGAIIDFIQESYRGADGIVINPGAFTHYSYAIRDCITGTDLKTVEVHISDINNREEWRKKSVLSDICAGVISGQGVEGYVRALDYFKDD
ncbi:MAG: type II 3-dehydroquinate dehydratase [candidate division Zixibacteria bacterium]|nr:type II 3-dehydroquinate dehydratase [candidate division Zixibacteria bacterium]